MMHFIHEKSSFMLLLHLLVTYDAVSAMTCPASVTTIKKVDGCPRNVLEWDFRASKKNCSSIDQQCVSKEKFLYHCVLNGDGTQLTEVCAPFKYIHGQKCAEFDDMGKIIQENAYSCGNATIPCPEVYKSNELYKYQFCFDAVSTNIQRKEKNIQRKQNVFEHYRSDGKTLSLSVEIIVFELLFFLFYNCSSVDFHK